MVKAKARVCYEYHFDKLLITLNWNSLFSLRFPTFCCPFNSIYEPGPAFEEVKEEAMLDISPTDSTEFWLIQWPKDQSELEYLSFMYVNPTSCAQLRKRVEDLYKAHEQELEEANRILRQKIAEDQFLDLVSVETEVRSVYKELYSGVVIGSQVYSILICNHVLGLVHGIWTPVPQAVEDYIATPKPNGYQSLHTTVIPFLNESLFHLEVQIRTEDMDLIAERGIAAHYSGRGVSLELSGSDIGGGYELYVDEAKPRGDGQRGGGRSGGRSGGRRGGGRFGERYGGRDGGGRFDGRRGGRDGGRGHGGRGFGDKQSAGTPSAGKKTTFGDD
ncbi:putative GTP diphosphokinase RSH1, chloroplastic [Zea mays]|uniref:Putative GTP diphosphokinase RSH1, chloroplastic n=1 Tax=Zea mays TaxID=4577 RepID=A0A317Y4X4_MAIZE|nr:putative GTP diphosphokinase RSH1, chloroplastic [Zea mays]